MSRRRASISASQAVMTMVIAILGSATLIVPGGMITAAHQDAWLSAVIVTLAMVVVGGLWVWVVKLWPGRDLFQVTLAAAGPWLGGLISVVVLLWIYLILTGATWIGADAIVTGFLPDTPRVVIAASILLLPAAYAARSQCEVVVRLSQWTFWGILALLFLLIPLSTGEMDLQRLAPILAGGAGPLLKGVEVPAGFFAETAAIFALLPYVKGPPRPWRLLTAASLTAGGVLVLLNAWTVAIMGPQFPTQFQYPVLILAHVISIGDVLERLDALMMALWIAGEVAKIAFWYWLLCGGLARLTGVKDARTLVWPMFLLVTTGAMAWVESSPAYPPSLRAWAVLFAPVVSVAVPLLLLLATGLRSWIGSA
jgi:spore germination protein KB